MNRAWNIFLVALTTSMVTAGCGEHSGKDDGKPPRALHDKAGGFSYDPPPEWQITEFPGLKYLVSFGPRKNEFAANINVVDEKNPSSLPVYADGNIKMMKTAFKNITIISREDIKTQDNESAIKLIIEDEQEGRRLRQTFLFIGGSTRKFVVTGTALAEGGAELDPVFDKSLKTFRLH
jgi:hypothetical protein